MYIKQLKIYYNDLYLITFNLWLIKMHCLFNLILHLFENYKIFGKVTDPYWGCLGCISDVCLGAMSGKIETIQIKFSGTFFI